jgi:hypothetical protein
MKYRNKTETVVMNIYYIFLILKLKMKGSNLTILRVIEL